MSHLHGRRVAFLATDGFEDSELTHPWEGIAAHEAMLTMVAPSGESIAGEHGHVQPVDLHSASARAADFDALVLPGGVGNADQLRLDEDSIDFARGFFEQHKPVAVICHGAWLLIEAEVVRGRRMTSYPSLRTDLRNAGAEWVDESVVVDHGLVSSRTPADLPAFTAKTIEEIAEGVHAGQSA